MTGAMTGAPTGALTGTANSTRTVALNVAIVGAGWAGMAAAVAAVQAGHRVTVLEASRTLGGRARAVQAHLPDGSAITIDNGQHILIGAYIEALRLMQCVGVAEATALQRRPLSMPFVDGAGLQTPTWAAQWPAPLDALAAIATARGWSLGDKWSLMRSASLWQLRGFQCKPELSVADLCKGVSPKVLHDMIEPLCVSALNTPAHRASGQVFLRVLKDALFGIRGGSHLLLPRCDLSALFPAPAAHWLQAHGGTVRIGERVTALRVEGDQWQVNGEVFDRVIWATSSSDAARALTEYARAAPESIAKSIDHWTTVTNALHFEAIATLYAFAEGARLPHPMLALRWTEAAPAQFVFDRGQLGGPAGLLAFVVSASSGSRDEIEAAVLQQARTELSVLGLGQLTPVMTVVEKRATFACTPGLVRPAATIAPGLLAAGDYVDGPYPATLEGAVRSGLAAASAL